MMEIDEQIGYIEREIEYLTNFLPDSDDLPINKAILESLNRLKNLEK